ncbi:hypothetical protein BJX63DRAFT_429422 [Aspergillus granulosus]|uniref:Retrotransposon gag domain-containing protein n=1 Tax=Aspergillus granulosus TaxID=176169 RepID=A0ABR4HRW6_9EURO
MEDQIALAEARGKNDADNETVAPPDLLLSTSHALGNSRDDGHAQYNGAQELVFNKGFLTKEAFATAWKKAVLIYERLVQARNDRQVALFERFEKIAQGNKIIEEYTQNLPNLLPIRLSNPETHIRFPRPRRVPFEVERWTLSAHCHTCVPLHLQGCIRLIIARRAGTAKF